MFGWWAVGGPSGFFLCVCVCETAVSTQVTHDVGHRCPTLQSVCILPTAARVLGIQECLVVILGESTWTGCPLRDINIILLMTYKCITIQCKKIYRLTDRQIDRQTY